MRPDSSVFGPLIILFVTSLNGPNVHEAFSAAFRQFTTAGPGLVYWAEIVVLNVLLFAFLVPIFKVHISCIRSREPSHEEIDRAMRHLNGIHLLAVLVSVAVFAAGEAIRYLLARGLPSLESGLVGELLLRVAEAAISGYFVGVLLALQFERRLYEARISILNLGPRVPIARRSLISRVFSILVAIVLFLIVGAFSFAGSFFSNGLRGMPPMAQGDMLSAPDLIFHARQFEGLRGPLNVFFVKLLMMGFIFGQMLWQLRSIIERPLATISESLRSLNARGKKTTKVIDILHDDEFAPVYREINELILRQEGQLEISRKRLEDVLELAADPILAFDSEGRIRVFNTAAEAVFACPRSAALERSVGDFLVAGAGGFVEAHQDGVARLAWKAADASPLVLESHLSKGEGEAWTTVILHDIRKQAEIEENLRQARVDAENASRMKSEFLANMSHELRTPLNAILGFTQLLGDDRNLTEAQREKVRVITRSGEHLLSLINDILDISKIEAGRMELHEAVFDLHEFIGDIRDMFEQRCRKKGLSLYVETLEGLPRYVRGDLGKLRQVMINLVGNAVKFTDEGGVGILAGSEGGAIRFAVRDTGRGIPAAELDLVMKPFVQASTTDHEGGTGLGLAISSRFVSMMGGRLEVRSELGAGSEFSFALALAESGEAPSPDRDKDLSIGVDPEAAIRVLVVDDQESNRLVLREMLERIGFQVDEAEDGRAAFDRAIQTKYAIVFMDIKMPVMDGYQAVSLFKGDARTREIPVFALTASAFNRDEKKVDEAGFDGFLAKPFKRSALHALIRDRGGLGENLETKNDVIELPGPTVDARPSAREWEAVGAELRSAIEDAVAINDFASVAALAERVAPVAPSLAFALSSAASSYDEAAIADLIKTLTREAGDGR